MLLVRFMKNLKKMTEGKKFKMYLRFRFSIKEDKILKSLQVARCILTKIYR